MEAAVEKRWSVTVSDLQARTYILDYQLRVMREKHFSSSSFLFVCFFFFLAHYGLFGANVLYLQRVRD